MVDLEDLHKTWSIITKNRDMKTDAQAINFFRAIQHGKNLERVVDILSIGYHSQC